MFPPAILSHSLPQPSDLSGLGLAFREEVVVLLLLAAAAPLALALVNVYVWSLFLIPLHAARRAMSAAPLPWGGECTSSPLFTHPRQAYIHATVGSSRQNMASLSPSLNSTVDFNVLRRSLEITSGDTEQRKLRDRRLVEAPFVV